MEEKGSAQDAYFRLIEERWERVDKTDLSAIMEFNEWKRSLRHMMLDEE